MIDGERLSNMRSANDITNSKKWKSTKRNVGRFKWKSQRNWIKNKYQQNKLLTNEEQQ